MGYNLRLFPVLLRKKYQHKMYLIHRKKWHKYNWQRQPELFRRK